MSRDQANDANDTDDHHANEQPDRAPGDGVVPDGLVAHDVAVAVGSDDLDNPAITLGIALARSLGVPLRLLHVACDGTTIDGDALCEQIASVDATIAIRFESNHAADVVSGLVPMLTPRTLVVLKSQHANRWSGKVSIAEHVLDAFPGIVALIGPEATVQPSLTGPIVLALDGSLDAERALRSAVVFTDVLGSWLVAVRVVPEPANHDAVTEAAHYLGTATAGLDAVEAVTPSSNDPVSAVTNLAREHDAALVVLSSHGNRATKRATLGRTSMGVVAAATQPVILVGPDIDRDGPRSTTGVDRD